MLLEAPNGQKAQACHTPFYHFVWTCGCYFAIIFAGLDPYQGAGMMLLICGGCSPTFVDLIFAMATYSRQKCIDYLKCLSSRGALRLFGGC